MKMHKRFLVTSLLMLLCITVLIAQPNKPGKEYYQLTIYYFETDSQEQQLDKYLKHALMPAMHRMKVKQVGVFKPIANDTAQRRMIITLVALPSLEALETMELTLRKDVAYQQTADTTINQLNTRPFARFEKIIMRKFAMAPRLQTPALNGRREERIYELRSYESASEKLYRNKVHMFNEGNEIGLFKALDFNAVFYGEVLAGTRMPNLMYMTAFENKAARDAHWKTFGESEAWKKLRDDPFYKGNVSHIDIWFLRAAPYSDF